MADYILCLVASLSLSVQLPIPDGLSQSTMPTPSLQGFELSNYGRMVRLGIFSNRRKSEQLVSEQFIVNFNVTILGQQGVRNDDVIQHEPIAMVYHRKTL